MKKVCQWATALRFQKIMPGPVSFNLLTMDQDVKLSATVPSPCLFTSYHDDQGLVL